MLALLLLVLISLGLSHWLLEPLGSVLKPLLSLDWLPWGLLGLLIWLFAGGASDRDPGGPES
jgi:hypothetical protein